MSELTRRKFLMRASLVAAAAGGLVGGLASGVLGVPRLFRLTGRTHHIPVTVLDANQPETVVAHVRDVGTSEVAVMVGTRQVVYRDPALVERLMSAARRAVTR